LPWRCLAADLQITSGQCVIAGLTWMIASPSTNLPQVREGPRRHSANEGGRHMGKEARVGLLLGASACLLAVMVDWVVGELNQR
jgi:hypothetical protein